MDIVLVPGFWLDGSSWEQVTPALERAGHRVHPLTLPGLEAMDSPRSGIGLRDHIDAVIAVVDALDPGVVLVGHSGGGAIVHGVVDARPDRVSRVVYVDSGPLGDGGVINDQLPVDGDEIPLPEWEVFDAPDLRDLDPELREQFRARAIPQPRAVAQDQQRLSDERRFDVPATVIACEFSRAELEQWISAGSPYMAELARVKDFEIVELPTGHWPQFTRPAELAEAILAAVSKESAAPTEGPAVAATASADSPRWESRAVIATERPERWSKQLVSHLGRRAAIEETSEGRALALSKGTGIVATGDGALTLIARGSDEEHTAAVQDILQRHLLRFATREQLTIEWEPIAPID